MGLQKFDDVTVREDDLSFRVKNVLSFLSDEHRDEVNKLDNDLLAEVDLCTLDVDQLITDIFLDGQVDFVLEHVVNHQVVFGLQQLEDVFSSDIKVHVVGYGNLEFLVLCHFSNQP